MNRRVLYPSGMLGLIIICLALAATGYLMPAPTPLAERGFGLVFPSPDLWNLLPSAGEILNVAGIALSSAILYLINKNYSLIRTGQPLGASFFRPLCFSNLPVGGHWSTMPFVTLFVLVIFATLFSQYRPRNATRAMFFAATCLSVGSMFEYAFIPLALATFIGAFIMEAMRAKEVLAMGLGLIAPYWVGIGFGLINPLDMRIPVPHTIFAGNLSPEAFVTLTVTGVMALCAAILSLYNGLILYAGNTRVRRSILTINTFGIIASMAMIFDVDNLPAYLGVCYIWVANQLANLFTLRDLRRGGLLYWLLQLLIFSIAMIYFLALHEV